MSAVSISRWEAAKIIERVFRADAYSDILIHELFRKQSIQIKDRALITELVCGTIRWKRKLDFYLESVYTGSWAKMPRKIKVILELGLYQLLFLDKIPAFAVIHESVEHIKIITGPRWSGTANAILRKFASENPPITCRDDWTESQRISIEWSHPEWMVDRWIRQLGKQRTEQLCRINNERPVLSLRVNQCKGQPAQVISELEALNYNPGKSRFIEHFIRIPENRGIFETRLFREGIVTVQDESAGIAAALLAPQAGDHILDMAAAPGGKTGYLAEISQNAVITAMDMHGGRIKRLQDTLKRLGHIIQIIQGDGLNCPVKSMDKILLDAPCSGLGVLRKRAELRWRIREEQIQELAKLQKELLKSAVRCLNSGGVIVYSTCTITPEENQSLIQWFLESYPEFTIDPADQWISSDVVTPGGWVETWPDLHQMDGSFACRLKHNGVKS